jgi:hypothetical protein
VCGVQPNTQAFQLVSPIDDLIATPIVRTLPLPPPSEPQVKRGNYATVINIHNPFANDAQICKKVVLAGPERFPNYQQITPTKRYLDVIKSDYAMSIDCQEIVNLLTQSNIPFGQFIDGFVIIDSLPVFGPASAMQQDLDVVVVTTSAALPDTAVVGATNIPLSNTVVDATPHHDLTPVPGKLLPAGTWLH